MGIQTTWGVKLIAKYVDSPSTVKINASDMKLEGYVDDTETEYRNRSVVRTELGGTISCAAPACGRRYFGFVIYDQLDVETIEVWINGDRMGVAVADGNNHRERLFTLQEPYDFGGGEEIILKTPADARVVMEPTDWIKRGPLMEMSPYRDHRLTGNHLNEIGVEYRVECIVFLTELPPEMELPCDFAYIQADLIGSVDDNVDMKCEVGSPLTARLTWITTWDVECRVEYWEKGSQNHKIIEENRPWTNHRINLEELVPETNYCYKLSAIDRKGQVVESDIETFVSSTISTVVGSAISGHVPITIRNESDSSYGCLPIRCGVPFPEGALVSPEQLRLMHSNGTEIPIQSRILGRWSDWSVKWLLLEFQASVPARGIEIYSLQFGSAINTGLFESSLSVCENGDTVIVDTGRLKITLDKSRFALFDKVSLDNLPYLIGSRLVVKTPDGREYVSTNSKPTSIVIEESGPLACVVRVEGDHASVNGKTFFKSIFRIHAYAGLPYMRIDHTFVNNVPEEFSEISSMYLELDMPLGDHEEIDVLQTHDNRYLVDGESSRGRQEGEFRIGNVGVGIPDFWQQYPKSMQARRGRIKIGVCPELDSSNYKDDSDQHRLYFYMQDGVYRFREGLSKTHTMYIGGDTPSFPLPVAQMSPAWYCSSGAFGDIGPSSEKRFEDYEAKITETCEEYVNNREIGRTYGMLNYGDWERSPNWGNCEYDTGFVMLRQWARSGDVRWLEEGYRAVLHHRDVDTCHVSVDEINRGGVYRHCIGHTGGYYPNGLEIKGASLSGQLTVSHTWVDGFLLHYFLTGDVRSLETAKMAADRWDSHYTRSYDFINCRNNGWHLIHSMAMYNATYDQFYLNAAHIVVARTLERQGEDGGWGRMLVPGHCTCNSPRHTGEAGFMIGIILDGLRLYHQATGNQSVADSIIRGAQYLIDDMWLEEEGDFLGTSCPLSGAGTREIAQYLGGISYAWRISGSSQMESVLDRGVQRMIDELDPVGRLMSANLRAIPKILFDRVLGSE